MNQAERYTEALKRHDRDLFCRLEADGFYKVYLKSARYETYEVNCKVVSFLVPDFKFVVALSDTWSIRGKPVEWGLLPLMEKIRSIDSQNKDAEMYQLEEQFRKTSEAKERDFNNKTEAFLYDFHSQFAKTFKDFNTSTVNKKDKRRIKNA